MSEVSAELDELLAQREAANVAIERRQMAQRLLDNRDFKKLILEGFCLHDAATFAQESGDPALDKQARKDALNLAQASGHLKRFMNVTIQMGAYPERNMAALEQAIDEVRGEEGAA